MKEMGRGKKLKISLAVLAGALALGVATVLIEPDDDQSIPAIGNSRNPSSHSESLNEALSPETREKLSQLRRDIRSWAPLCSDGTLTFHECPFGDALEYMGMLCLSGDEGYCEQVKKAQSTDGRFWRSPGLVGLEHPTGWATFSRDMARGAWAYIVAKKDKEAALRWMSYIHENDAKLCAKSGEGFDACATRATFWTFATQVYDYLGLPHEKKMKGFKFLIQRLYSPIEARVQPKGFELLLTAEMLYTLQEMEKRGAKLRNRRTLRRIAQIIHHREPDHPFYRYLVEGVNQKSADWLLANCRRTRPEVLIDDRGALYRIDLEGPMSEKKWEQGGGHYCIFMINVLLGNVE